MVRKSIITVLFCFSIGFAAHAQYYSSDAASKASNPKKGWDWNKVYPGGNFGLGFGRGYFYGEFSPLAGYWVNNWFTPGVMLTYIYMNYSTFNFQTHTVGISPFARAFIFKWLFAHVETGFFTGNGLLQEPNSGNIYFPSRQESRLLFSPMVGGGVNFPLGKRGGFVIMMLFNLNYKRDFYLPGANQQYTFRAGFYF
jgi:hypothetical protein